MASTTGQSFDAIEREILTSPSSFTFERLITNLHAIVVAKGKDPFRTISIRPNLSFQLHRSEVVSVIKTDSGNYEVVTSFLGLYGASSPLPNFYTEQLMQFEQEEQTTARRFLDVIHQRIYQLYITAQQKYNVLSQVVEYHQRQFTQLMQNIVGTSDPAVQSNYLKPDSLLQFAGLYAQKQRSASGLKKLLESYLSEFDVAVRIEQFVNRKVTVPSHLISSLGTRSCVLGNNALLGDTLVDRNAKIVIHLGPISQHAFDLLVNDKIRWRCFEQMIKTYIDKPLEVDIQIALVTQSAKGIEIGQKQWCQLGYDTWLLTPSSGEEAENDQDILVTTLSLA